MKERRIKYTAADGNVFNIRMDPIPDFRKDSKWWFSRNVYRVFFDVEHTDKPCTYMIGIDR